MSARRPHGPRSSPADEMGPDPDFRRRRMKRVGFSSLQIGPWYLMRISGAEDSTMGPGISLTLFDYASWMHRRLRRAAAKPTPKRGAPVPNPRPGIKGFLATGAAISGDVQRALRRLYG